MSDSCADVTHSEQEREREKEPVLHSSWQAVKDESLVVTLNENNSRNKSAASDLVDSVFAIFGITGSDRM